MSLPPTKVRRQSYLIGIFNAEQELALGTLGQEIAEQRCPQAANMEMARW